MSAFLPRLRALKARIDKAQTSKGALQLELMLLLVETRPKELLWRDDYDSWDELLRKEKPCPVARFYHFERGLRLMTLEDARRFGVTAVATLTTAPTSYRGKLIKATRKWYTSHKSRPNHPAVSRFVWGERRKLAPEQDFVSRGRLIRYIDALKGQLKDAGVRPKPLSRVK
jgi:hypothetical protein